MCGAGKIVNPVPRGLSRMSMNTSEKQARLAQALRDNLRRRKAQARASDAAPEPTPSGAPEDVPPAR
jgi:hypothetical protein